MVIGSSVGVITAAQKRLPAIMAHRHNGYQKGTSCRPYAGPTHGVSYEVLVPLFNPPFRSHFEGAFSASPSGVPAGLPEGLPSGRSRPKEHRCPFDPPIHLAPFRGASSEPAFWAVSGACFEQAASAQSSPAGMLFRGADRRGVQPRFQEPQGRPSPSPLQEQKQTAEHAPGSFTDAYVAVMPWR